jgi:hypothetical protein
MIAALPYGLPRVVFGHGDPAQLYLGSWPDGTPFAPMHVETVCRD